MPHHLLLRIRRTLSSSTGLLCTLAFMLFPSIAWNETHSHISHGLAMHGTPALKADFSHFPYTNPQAKKQGKIIYGFKGSFNSLNPFIIKGNAPRGLWDAQLGYTLYDSLMLRNWDEPFSLYGLIAERVSVADDRSAISFHLNPKAKFNDGHPITSEDVLFSYQMLKKHGRPSYRSAYGRVDRVEIISPREISFHFAPPIDRELPLILAMMPIFPAHLIDEQTFSKTSLDPLPGSGPYKIEQVSAGQTVRLARNKNYWARDLPVKRGMDNFDQIEIQYFREGNSLFEAFRKGEIDVFFENDPKRWVRAYNFPALNAGKIIKRTIPTATPKGMYGLIFNTRRPIFQNKALREALGYFLDFEWLNHTLLFGLYQRTDSYFSGSNLSSAGKKASQQERDLLKSAGANIDENFLNGSYHPPRSDGSGRDRKLFRQGVKRLQQAGYKSKDGKLNHQKTGQPLAFTIMLRNRQQERIALALQRQLSRAGITLTLRLVDDIQYWDRLRNHDYDAILFTWTASLSPGNEQVGRWSQNAVNTPGSFNFAGASSPAIDFLIKAMLKAKNRDKFETIVRAYDRLLLSGFYTIPLFYTPNQWLAHAQHIKMPDKPSLYGIRASSWWHEKTNTDK